MKTKEGGGMDIQKEREVFEAWVGSNGRSIERFSDGSYKSMTLDKEWEAWQAAKAQAVPDTYTPIVLALEDVQSKIAKTSFLTMDEENENEVMAVNANELAAYIDELIEAQEST